MIRLRNPDVCPKCQGQSRVMQTHSDGAQPFRWRRRKCLNCGELWRTYESLINPLLIRLRRERTT